MYELSESGDLLKEALEDYSNKYGITFKWSDFLEWFLTSPFGEYGTKEARNFLSELELNNLVRLEKHRGDLYVTYFAGASYTDVSSVSAVKENLAKSFDFVLSQEFSNELKEDAAENPEEFLAFLVHEEFEAYVEEVTRDPVTPSKFFNWMKDSGSGGLVRDAGYPFTLSTISKGLKLLADSHSGIAYDEDTGSYAWLGPTFFEAARGLAIQHAEELPPEARKEFLAISMAIDPDLIHHLPGLSPKLESDNFYVITPKGVEWIQDPFLGVPKGVSTESLYEMLVEAADYGLVNPGQFVSSKRALKFALDKGLLLKETRSTDDVINFVKDEDKELGTVLLTYNRLVGNVPLGFGELERSLTVLREKAKTVSTPEFLPGLTEDLDNAISSKVDDREKIRIFSTAIGSLNNHGLLASGTYSNPVFGDSSYVVGRLQVEIDRMNNPNRLAEEGT